MGSDFPECNWRPLQIADCLIFGLLLVVFVRRHRTLNWNVNASLVFHQF